jgi:YidC/Oxa1 family membrane protein insertase
MLGEGYNLFLQVSASNFLPLSSYVLNLDSGIADSEDYILEHPKEKMRDYKIIAEINNEIEKYSLAKLKNKQEDIGKIDWASIRSKYFIIGIYGDELIDVNRIDSFNNNNSPAINLGIAIPRDNFNHEFRLYFGPLIREELTAFRPGFEKVMEGPFIELLRPIANLFAAIFKFFRGFIPSYGIIIIIISIVLKILLYPLTHKSFESTHKMQKVQPLMKELQAKYKNDPQTLNQEMRKLYKEHNVSPLGGCLPMLLQMPIIFAIYPVIRYSIDMRQNSFLWLADLSEPDKTLILPIAMAVFMFVQQKLMSPSKAKVAEMDEKQQAAQQSQKMMMYLMPVMMFFIFKSLSAGLVLYWTVFSIIGTIQQYFIKKKIV